MVVNSLAVKRRLDKLLMTMSLHRLDQTKYRNRGDAAGVERCDGLLKLD